MNNLLNRKGIRKNFRRALTFVLTFAILAGTVSIGFKASAMTQVFMFTGIYTEGGRNRDLPGVLINIYINGVREFSDITPSPRSDTSWNRTTIPNGSRISVSTSVPDGFRLHIFMLNMNGERTRYIDPVETTFHAVANHAPWLDTLAFTFLFVPLETETPIEVLVDGQEVIADVPPVLRDGRTFLPLRAITEALGTDVQWDPTTQQITLSRGNQQAILRINNTTVTYGDGRTSSLDVAPFIQDGRTMVPVRFIAEFTGSQVHWDAETRTVTITS